MNKKMTRVMAFFMSFLMIVTILPTEYLLSYALEIEKNSISYVDTKDNEITISDGMASIDAKTHNKEYELKYQFNYAIDYSQKSSYQPGEMVYVLPSLGFYDNGVTAGYILPTDISVNTNNSDLWSYETTNIGNSRVIKITNKVALTPEVVTEGYMQFATTINPRTQLMGEVTINPIMILISEDGGQTAIKTNQLNWGYTLYKDDFSISEEVKDVQVENVSELGEDASSYYWTKYEINISSEDVDLHTLQANNFKVNIFLEKNAELYSVNGNKEVSLIDNSYSTTFSISDWNYTQLDTPKTLSVIVKYPKDKFDGKSVKSIASLDVQYVGVDTFDEVASAEITHELHDYNVKYDGDLFAVNTTANTAYEISYNSLERGEASPFSFYMSGLSRYNQYYDMIIENDALEILTKDGFYRLGTDEYSFNRITINDLSHFTNSIGEQYTSLNFAITGNDGEIIKKGEVGNNSQTIVLPEGTTIVDVLFYGLESSLYLDKTAIKVDGAIDLKDASSVLKEGELRNLVNLIVLDENANILNKVDETNYVGSDAERLANKDLENYGMYLQRDIDSEVVTYKSSQINVTTKFNPTKSIYNETSKVQESTLDITSFFAAPGKVESFSLYDILPENVNFTGKVTYSADADLKLSDGTIIPIANVNDFLNKYAKVTTIENYKDSNRTYVNVTFVFEDGKEICYDSTMTQGFTSGKITTSIDVEVPNVDSTYNNVAAMIFNDVHSETMLKTKDNGDAPLVSKDGILWVDIDNDGNVDELVDYASATLTSVYVEAANVPEVPEVPDIPPIEPEKTPSIKIEKTSDKEVYKIGETIVYTIKVTNNGEVDLTDVVVTDKLEGEFISQEGITINKNVASFDMLKIGESKTLTYKVVVPIDSKDKDVIKNVVDVTTAQGVSDEDDVIVTIEVPEVPDIPIEPEKTPSIKIEKTSDKEVYKIGETIVYTIKVTNNGEVDLTDVVIKETLGGIFDKVNGATIDKDTLTFETLKVGESKTLTYKAIVPATAKDKDVIKNIVTVDTKEKVSDKASKDVIIEVPIVVVEKPNIEIIKTADKAKYYPDDTIIYTIKVTNNGNVDLTNVKVIETLNGNWNKLTNNVKVIDDKNVTIKSLKVGDSEVLTYLYVVPKDAKDNTSIKNIVKANEENYNLNVSDDVTVTIVEKDNPSLAITKTADKKSVKAGETITYTIVVKNTGNIDLTNVNVVDALQTGKFAEYKDLTRVNDYTLIIPTLKIGESKTLTFTYVVPEDTKESSITNNVSAIETTHSLKVEDHVKVDISKSIVEIVQTGDNAPIFIFLGIAILAFFGMCIITIVSSKKHR